MRVACEGHALHEVGESLAGGVVEWRLRQIALIQLIRHVLQRGHWDGGVMELAGGVGWRVHKHDHARDGVCQGDV